MPRGFANVGTSPFLNHFPTLRAGKSAIIPSQKKRSSSTMFQPSTIILFILFIVISFFMGVEYSKKKDLPSQATGEPSTHIPTTVPTRCWSNQCSPSIINPPFIDVSPVEKANINPDIRNTRDIFNDPYIPPVKNNNYSYKQIGILTSTNLLSEQNKEKLILPLLGRRHFNGRDKWNYYTISNTGSLNTKLPIKVRGKTCTNEYGCDEVFSGDVVYVEGYDRQFKVTIYENNHYNYDPFT
jgi:preprotein translocase subunit SecG